MDLELIKKIKDLAISAIFSDDILMDIFVLKGAAAMDLIYEVLERSSLDLDFSMSDKIELENMKEIKARVEKALNISFNEAGFKIFDLSIEETPKSISPDLADFWGGYQVEFKVIELDRYTEQAGQIENLRRGALIIGRDQRRKLTMEISKHEFCETKDSKEIASTGITVYVYTPEMIVIEKLRAICQQMPEYLKLVKASRGSPRARDFLDIYILVEHFKIDLNSNQNSELLKKIFQAKRVPIKLIHEIKNYREFHRPNFTSVKDTVKPDYPLKNFDFYFDYVVSLCEKLETLWNV